MYFSAYIVFILFIVNGEGMKFKLFFVAVALFFLVFFLYESETPEINDSVKFDVPHGNYELREKTIVEVNKDVCNSINYYELSKNFSFGKNVDSFRLGQIIKKNNEVSAIGPHPTVGMPVIAPKALRDILYDTKRTNEYNELTEFIRELDDRQLNNFVHSDGTILSEVVSENPNIDKDELTKLINAGLKVNLWALIVATSAGVNSESLKILLKNSELDPRVDWKYDSLMINLAGYAALHKQAGTFDFWLSNGVDVFNNDKTVNAFDLIGVPNNKKEVVEIQKIVQVLLDKNYYPSKLTTIVWLYPLLLKEQQNDLKNFIAEKLSNSKNSSDLQSVMNFLSQEFCSTEPNEYLNSLLVDPHMDENTASLASKEIEQPQSGENVNKKERVEGNAAINSFASEVLLKSNDHLKKEEWQQYVDFLQQELGQYEPNISLYSQLSVLRSGIPDHEFKKLLTSGTIDTKIVEVMILENRISLLKQLSAENYKIVNSTSSEPNYRGATTEMLMYIGNMK